jgi:hypothetical protein
LAVTFNGNFRISSDPNSSIPRKLQEWVDGVLTVQASPISAIGRFLELTVSQLELPASKFGSH